MPFKFERDKKKIPRKLRRNVKLTIEQREEIRDNIEGLSNHALAAKYGVSRRLVQFIRFPERQAKNLLDRQQRGGSKIYYNQDKHRNAIAQTRAYKKALDKEGLLYD